MQTRRDQVQAHSFMVRRLSTAMAEADPDAVEAPLRRTRTGTFIGMVIAALLCVGFLVFGLLVPGGATNWKSEGTVVAVKGGAGRYIYSEGALWPVVNQASALLLSQSGETSQVAADSLEGTPIGSPLGIGGAPDSLPSTEAEGDLIWQVCATTVDTGDGEGPLPLTSLSLGRSAQGAPVEDGGAVLVEDPDGAPHLLWSGTRMRIDEEHGALEALGYGTSTPHPVSAALLSTLPAGPELAPDEVKGRGAQGPRIGDAETRVGQVFTVPAAEGGGDQYYVLTRDGLVPTDATRARMLLGDPRTAEDAYGGGDAEAIALSVNDLRPHLSGDGPRDGGGLPGSPPSLTGSQGSALCTVRSGDGAPALALAVPSDIAGRAARPPAGSTAACTAPDLVDIPAGEGGLVKAAPSGGSTMRNAYFLITDTGAKYPVFDSASAEKLGYPPAGASTVPTALLDLLPTGPELTPEAAAQPASAPAEPGEPRCPTP